MPVKIGVEDPSQPQAQYHDDRGLCHHDSGSPSARSFSRRSPSPPPPSFTQYPSPPRSLVRDGQTLGLAGGNVPRKINTPTALQSPKTSPLRPRLVVSRSTCPPLSPSPHANSFVIGTAVINTHTIAPLVLADFGPGFFYTRIMSVLDT